MSKPVFRNPDLFQQLPMRDYFRNNFPNGNAGFVVEDLDLVLRQYGSKYGTDKHGRFFLIEQKHPGAYIGKAQEMTFGMMHELWRKADPSKERYVGFYVVNVAFDANGNPEFPIVVNRVWELTEQLFEIWIEHPEIIPSLFD